MLNVMLLAAGRGSRLHPVTLHTPKALIKVGGKPLLFWHMEALAQAGATGVVINVCDNEPGGRQIMQAVGDGSRWSVPVAWSKQQQRYDSGGDVAYALPLLGDKPFALINADIHTDYPREKLLNADRAPDGERCLARMILVPPPTGSTGDCGLREGKVGLPDDGPLWAWSGMSVLHPRLFADAPEGTFHLWHDMLKAALVAGQADGEIYRGHWHDAGTHVRLANLRDLLQRDGRLAG